MRGTYKIIRSQNVKKYSQKKLHDLNSALLHEAKKEVIEQITSKLQASNIKKANFYPHREHGWFGFKLAADTGASGGSVSSDNNNYTTIEMKNKQFI